jgi:hypothetical protein
VKVPSQPSASSALVLCKKPKTGVVASSAIKSIKVSDYHEEIMLQSYLKLFSLDLRPLSSINCEGFESVISTAIELGAYYNGNITCRDLMPPRNKVRSALDSVSEFQLLYLKKNFEGALINGGIGIALDFWTDKSKRHPYLGVTCHWIQDEKLVENLLAFYLWPFDHSKTRDIIADVLKKKNFKRP